MLKSLLLICCSILLGGWVGGCFDANDSDSIFFVDDETYVHEDDICFDALVHSPQIDVADVLCADTFIPKVSAISWAAFDAIVDGRMPSIRLPLRAPPIIR